MEGPSKAEITCKDNKDGTCTVSYLPTAPGDYNIIVRFDDKHIAGSPFTAKITGEFNNEIGEFLKKIVGIREKRIQNSLSHGKNKSQILIIYCFNVFSF